MRITVVTDRWAAVHFRLRARYRRVGQALRSTTGLSLQAHRQRNYRQILTAKVRHSRLERTRSEVNDRVALRPRAADEKVAVGRGFERIRADSRPLLYADLLCQGGWLGNHLPTATGAAVNRGACFMQFSDVKSELPVHTDCPSPKSRAGLSSFDSNDVAGLRYAG